MHTQTELVRIRDLYSTGIQDYSSSSSNQVGVIYKATVCLIIITVFCVSEVVADLVLMPEWNYWFSYETEKPKESTGTNHVMLDFWK